MKKQGDDYVCNVFRAQYERKKVSIQDKRYEQTRDMAETLETRKLTMAQIENLSLTVKDQWLSGEGIDVQRLRIALRDAHIWRSGRRSA